MIESILVGFGRGKYQGADIALRFIASGAQYDLANCCAALIKNNINNNNKDNS